MRPNNSPIPKTPLSSMHVIIVNAGIPSVRPETSKGGTISNVLQGSERVYCLFSIKDVE